MFTKIISEWYYQNKRSFPWRENTDAYRVWLSEIILQQTRALQGLFYFSQFIEKYPNIFKLAEATQDEVFKMWEGLGYYSRAKNLHKTSKIIVDQYNGRFPESYNALLKLPGVGPYTAAAIASICYGEAVAVVDGNVYRVLSRFFLIEHPINAPKSYDVFFKHAQNLISKTHPGDFNQAVMELGALICLPKNPKCSDCPTKENCKSFLTNQQNNFPKKLPKKPLKTRHLNFFILTDDHQCLLLEHRNEKDIWKGLYTLPILETPKSLDTTQMAKTVFKKWKIALHTNLIYQQKHKLTHQELYLYFWKIDVSIDHKKQINKENDCFLNANKQQMQNLAFPLPVKRFLEAFGFL